MTLKIREVILPEPPTSIPITSKITAHRQFHQLSHQYQVDQSASAGSAKEMPSSSTTASGESLSVVNGPFQRVEASFPALWHEDKWYPTVVCIQFRSYSCLEANTLGCQIGALIGGSKASVCGDPYTYLINQPQ